MLFIHLAGILLFLLAHALMCAIHSLRSVQAATLFTDAMKNRTMKRAWQGTMTIAS
jgi:hypothetical protein